MMRAVAAVSSPAFVWKWVGFLALHVPLALVMHQVEAVATLHAWATLGVGVWWAVNRRVEQVTWAAAYIVGAEVLWRMTDAGVVHEFGKYAMSLVLLVALFRTTRRPPPVLALVYFLLLLPAAWLTAFQYPFGEARQMISFNLSGPFALFMSLWFFARCVVLDRGAFARLALVLVGPVLGIAAAAAFSTFTAADLSFGSASNFVTSGGYGPNQVSAMLGLGVVACALGMAFGGRSLLLRTGLIGGFAFMLVQSALTFSRTGLVLAVIGLAVLLPFVLRTSRNRLAVLALLSLLFVFVQYWMIPTLDAFTSGAFIERYTDPRLSNRETIIAVDLKIWSDHPFLGIGAGAGNEARASYGFVQSAAHTEYTRMLAEHGIFGLLALGALLAFGAIPVLRRQGSAERGVHLALVFWAFAFMVVSAFRLAAPAFLLGLCWAPLMLEGVLFLRKHTA